MQMLKNLNESQNDMWYYCHEIYSKIFCHLTDHWCTIFFYFQPFLRQDSILSDYLQQLLLMNFIITTDLHFFGRNASALFNKYTVLILSWLQRICLIYFCSLPQGPQAQRHGHVGKVLSDHSVHKYATMRNPKACLKKVFFWSWFYKSLWTYYDGCINFFLKFQ